MAKVCDVCGKHASVGHTISHAHNATLRKWQPNLREVRALVNGQVKRIKVCTKCLKAGKVLKAPHKVRAKPPVEAVMTPVMEVPVVAAPAAEITSAV
jgi:large subunit ribosomal protein L28